MDSTKLALRPSSLGRYEACPASYYLQADAPPQIDSDVAAFGKRVHAHMSGEAVTLSPAEAEMAELLTDALASLYETAADVEETEVTMTIDLPGAVLTGTADRIEIRGNRLTVIDYKTGRNEVTGAEGNFQLQAYALMAAKLHRELEEFEVCVIQPLAKGGGSRAIFRRQDLRVVWQRLLDLVEAIRVAGLRPSPVKGDHCTYCPALSICPAHRRGITELAVTDAHPGRWEMVPVSDKVLLWHKMRAAKKAIAAIEGLFRKDLEANADYYGGEIYLGKGRTQRDVSDAAGLFQDLNQTVGLSAAEFATACKVRLTELEPLVKKRQAKKGKEFAAWYTQILDRHSETTTTRGSLETK